MIDTILEYIGQQSTWKGIIGIATAAGIAITPDLSAAIVAAGMALIGLINVFRNESK